MDTFRSRCLWLLEILYLIGWYRVYVLHLLLLVWELKYFFAVLVNWVGVHAVVRKRTKPVVLQIRAWLAERRRTNFQILREVVALVALLTSALLPLQNCLAELWLLIVLRPVPRVHSQFGLFFVELFRDVLWFQVNIALCVLLFVRH